MARASQIHFNCLDNDQIVKDFLVMAFNFMNCCMLPHRKLLLNKLLWCFWMFGIALFLVWYLCFFSLPFALKIAKIGAGRCLLLTLKPSFVSSSCIKSGKGIIHNAKKTPCRESLGFSLATILIQTFWALYNSFLLWFTFTLFNTVLLCSFHARQSSNQTPKNFTWCSC